MLARSRLVLSLAALSLALSAAFLFQVGAAEPQEDPAVERTRQTTRMLDELYKTAVVLITKHYVDVDSDLPAGTAAIALFDAMKEKGWHEVRLLDATGQPIEERNAPRDAFETEAVKQLLAGKSWHEEIVTRDGERYLRTATPLPVVLAKCTMCHEHYKQAKPNQPIGALSYQLRVE